MFLAVAVVLAVVFNNTEFNGTTILDLGGVVMTLGIVGLSLVLVTGYSGQVSLCQFSFMGIGAFVMGKVAGGGSLLGLLAATIVCAGVGALIALPTIRLRDLYLALATFAFADAVANGFFTDTHIYGCGGLNIGRIVLPGLSFGGDASEFLLVTVFFVLSAWLVLAIRRSLFGRRLVALNDSPAAYATVGPQHRLHQSGGVRHRRRHGRSGRCPVRHRAGDGRHHRLRLLPRHHLRAVRDHLEHPDRVRRVPGRRSPTWCSTRSGRTASGSSPASGSS